MSTYNWKQLSWPVYDSLCKLTMRNVKTYLLPYVSSPLLATVYANLLCRQLDFANALQTPSLSAGEEQYLSDRSKTAELMLRSNEHTSILRSNIDACIGKMSRDEIQLQQFVLGRFLKIVGLTSRKTLRTATRQTKINSITSNAKKNVERSTLKAAPMEIFCLQAESFVWENLLAHDGPEAIPSHDL